MSADPLEPFSVELFGKDYLLKPRVDLETNLAELGEHLQSQPTQFAYYASIRDEAVNTAEAFQVALKQLEGDLANRFREAGTFKITEDSVKKAILADPSYQEMQSHLVDANLIAAKMNSLVQAFEHRRHMLVALASRANNTTFNDSDVKVKQPTHPKNLGKFPGKKA